MRFLYLKSLFLFRSFGLSNSLCCSFLIYALIYGVGACPNTYAETNDSAREKAFTLMSKGRQSFEAEQYSEAIRLWREAYHTYQDNKLLLFIASTYLLFKSLSEKSELFKIFLILSIFNPITFEISFITRSEPNLNS